MVEQHPGIMDHEAASMVWMCVERNRKAGRVFPPLC